MADSPPLPGHEIADVPWDDRVDLGGAGLMAWTAAFSCGAAGAAATGGAATPGAAIRGGGGGGGRYRAHSI